MRPFSTEAGSAAVTWLRYPSSNERTIGGIDHAAGVTAW